MQPVQVRQQKVRIEMTTLVSAYQGSAKIEGRFLVVVMLADLLYKFVIPTPDERRQSAGNTRLVKDRR